MKISHFLYISLIVIYASLLNGFSNDGPLPESAEEVSSHLEKILQADELLPADDIKKLISSSMAIPDKPAESEWSRMKFLKLECLFRAAQITTKSIDPLFDAQKVPVLGVDPPSELSSVGGPAVPPEKLAQAKTEYGKRLRANAAYAEAYREQVELRRRMDGLESYIRLFVRHYFDQKDLSEVERLLKTYAPSLEIEMFLHKSDNQLR